VRLEHTKINPRKVKLGFTRAAWPRAAWHSASDLAPAAAWRKSSGQGWRLPRFIVARVYVPTHPVTSLKLIFCIYLRDKDACTYIFSSVQRHNALGYHLPLFFPFTDDDALHSHMRLLIIIITTITIFFQSKRQKQKQVTNIILL
jgi:hypothetical protein